MEVFEVLGVQTQSVVAGAVLSRKTTYVFAYKVIGIMFASFFFLERLYSLKVSLKDPDFRKFLTKIFKIIMTLSTVLVLTFYFVVMNGCTSKSLIIDGVPKTIELTSMQDDVIASTKKLNNTYHLDVTKLTRSIRAKYVNAKKKVHKRANNKNLIVSKVAVQNDDVTHAISKIDSASKGLFKRSLTFKACNKLLYAALASNKKFANSCSSYANALKNFSLDPKGLLKNLKKNGNTCERYGTSMLYRMRVRYRPIEDRWHDLNKWASMQLDISVEGATFRSVFITQMLHLSAYSKNVHNEYKSCKRDRLHFYEENKIMGIFPTKGIL